MSPADITNRFSFHPATTPERQTSHEYVRARCRDLAHLLNEALPDGREKSLAITHLEEVMFWGNAAIARQDDPVEPASVELRHDPTAEQA